MLHVKQALQALDSERFISELHAELNTLDGNHFPLERACQHGGLPDPASLHVCSLGEVTHRATLLVVPIVLSFNERRGAGCGGTAVEYHHLVDCQLTINPTTGATHMTIIESEPPDEL